MTRELTCNNCGWVHFGVSYEDAITQVVEFNRWLDHQPKAVAENYGGPRDLRQCFKCGGSHKNFREAVEGDAPRGCTLQGIIDEKT